MVMQVSIKWANHRSDFSLLEFKFAHSSFEINLSQEMVARFCQTLGNIN